MDVCVCVLRCRAQRAVPPRESREETVQMEVRAAALTSFPSCYSKSPPTRPWIKCPFISTSQKGSPPPESSGCKITFFFGRVGKCGRPKPTGGTSNTNPNGRIELLFLLLSQPTICLLQRIPKLTLHQRLASLEAFEESPTCVHYLQARQAPCVSTPETCVMLFPAEKLADVMFLWPQRGRDHAEKVNTNLGVDICRSGIWCKSCTGKKIMKQKKRIWEGHGLIDYLSLTSVFLAALKSQPEVRILRGGEDDLGNRHVFRLRRGDNEMSEDDDPLSCQSEADRPPGGGGKDPSLQPLAPGTDPVSIFVLAGGATCVLFYRKNLCNNRRNSRDTSAGLFIAPCTLRKFPFWRVWRHSWFVRPLAGGPSHAGL